MKQTMTGKLAMRQTLRIGYWLACVVVSVLSLMPLAYLPPVAFDWWDKAQHALAFMLLGTLGLLAYPQAVLRLLIGLLVFGAVIELAQATTGWRYGDWQDLLANALGLAIATLGYWWLRRRG